MLGVPLGIVTILLGLKAFTRRGLPLTRQKNLTGAKAKATGAACIAAGSIFIVTGIDSAVAIFKQWHRSNVSSQATMTLPVMPIPDASWQEYQSPDGRFSVLLPSLPVLTRNGAERTYSVDFGREAYAVTHSALDAPLADRKLECDKIQRAIAEQLSATLRSRTDKNVDDDLPACEMVLDVADGSIVRTLFVFTPTDVYQLIVTGPKGLESAGATDRFFESFKIRLDEQDRGDALDRRQQVFEGLGRITGTWQQRIWESQIFADPQVRQFLEGEGIVFTNWKEMMQRWEERFGETLPKRADLGK